MGLYANVVKNAIRDKFFYYFCTIVTLNGKAQIIFTTGVAGCLVCY